MAPILTLHQGDAEASFVEHPTEVARKALIAAAQTFGSPGTPRTPLRPLAGVIANTELPSVPWPRRASPDCA